MRIGLIYGGRSAEHTVSIESAKGVHQALLQLHHEILLIGISKEGKWYLQQHIVNPIQCTEPLFLLPADGIYSNKGKLSIDVAFATTHGTGGEDGNLQGLCFLCNIALCGCSTVSSALGMHKALASKLFAAHNIPVVPSITIDSQQDIEDIQLFEMICSELGKDLFVKPESSGSSIGVQALKQASHRALVKAVNDALLYSDRVLVQKLIDPLIELECGILRTQAGALVVAGPGRVVDVAKDQDACLSYRHKYGPVNTAYLQIPSMVSSDIENRIKDYAISAFTAIACDGYARLDFFVQEEQVYLNEINTIPGMTEKSHYPILLASSGYAMPEVLEHLMHDAVRRFKEEQSREYRAPEI